MFVQISQIIILSIVIPIYSMEYMELSDDQKAQEQEISGTYIHFQTADQKKFVIRQDRVPAQFIRALQMKEGTEQSGITLPTISSSVMEFAIDLFEAEAAFKKMGYDPFQQYEKIYKFLTKQPKFNLQKPELTQWLNFLNDLEFLGTSVTSLDAIIRMCAKQQTKSIMSMRSVDFHKLAISDKVRDDLTFWSYRYAFKQGFISDIPIADRDLVIDEAAREYEEEAYLSYCKTFLSDCEDYPNHLGGRKFCQLNSDEEIGEDDVIECSELKFADLTFDYNIKKYLNATLIVLDKVETVHLIRCVMLAQTGFHLLTWLTSISLEDIKFPNGIHPDFFKKNKMLENIRINKTDLTDLPKDLFKGLCLTSLDLRHNKLKRVDSELFIKIGNPTALYLENNPWDETMDWKSLPPSALTVAIKTGFPVLTNNYS